MPVPADTNLAVENGRTGFKKDKNANTSQKRGEENNSGQGGELLEQKRHGQRLRLVKAGSLMRSDRPNRDQFNKPVKKPAP